MATKHIAVWPQVRVFVNGEGKVLDRGDDVPAGVSAVDLENLVSFGAIAGVSGGVTEEPAASDTPDTVEAVLKSVGDDQDKAAAALATEQAKGDKARKTLVEKLEAIANPQGS